MLPELFFHLFLNITNFTFVYIFPSKSKKYQGGKDATNRRHGLGRWDFEDGKYGVGEYDHDKQCGHWIYYNNDGSIWYEVDW